MKRTAVVAGLMACVVGSLVLASNLWSWVLNFDPGFAFTHPPIPTGPALSKSVTIFLVDGLRLDASRRMPTLNALRSRGADIEAYVGTPSFSRPGRATIAVGAFPWVHGVTTNRQKRALAIDNIIRRVGAIGGTCLVAGSKIWSSLFADDTAKCGAYREGESKEGPGAFVRQIGDVRAAQEAGIAFVLERVATLRIADVVSTDFAAHEYGGGSQEYRDEVARTDVLLSGLVSHLDLQNETLIVTADHGHRDEGGHGGEEKNVLAIPIVIAGAGIRPATVAAASQADIAPTVAALLGASLPVGSFGSPIESILLGDDAKKAVVKEASLLQKQAFDKTVREKLGLSTSGLVTHDSLGAIREYRDADQNRYRPVVLAGSLFGCVFVGLLLRSLRPDHAALGFGLLVACALFVFTLVGPAPLRLPSLSFSAINYDEMLIPFFRWIMALAAIGTLASIASSLGWARMRAKSREADDWSQAASMGSLLSAIFGLGVVNEWWRSDLLSPLTLPGSDRMVLAFSLVLALASASFVTLCALSFLSLKNGRPLRGR